MTWNHLDYSLIVLRSICLMILLLNSSRDNYTHFFGNHESAKDKSMNAPSVMQYCQLRPLELLLCLIYIPNVHCIIFKTKFGDILFERSYRNQFTIS